MGCWIAPMGYVAGQDNKVRITVFRIDRRDTRPQPHGGVLAIERPFTYDMGVGEMDNFILRPWVWTNLPSWCLH